MFLEVSGFYWRPVNAQIAAPDSSASSYSKSIDFAGGRSMPSSSQGLL